MANVRIITRPYPILTKGESLPRLSRSARADLAGLDDATPFVIYKGDIYRIDEFVSAPAEFASWQGFYGFHAFSALLIQIQAGETAKLAVASW